MLIRITKLVCRDKAALLKEERKDRKADTRQINNQKHNTREKSKKMMINNNKN